MSIILLSPLYSVLWLSPAKRPEDDDCDGDGCQSLLNRTSDLTLTKTLHLGDCG